MAVSIKEIAKAAGVSTATVSRVINNSPKLSQKTRDKVLKIMKEMNYVPNSLARGLSNQKALNVALLINIEEPSSFHNPFFYEVMHGIETAVYKRGLSLIIASSRGEDKQEIVEWLMNEKRMQGIIIPSSLADGKLLNLLRKRKFPFVVIGKFEEGIKPVSWVDINNQQGGEQAVAHLIQNGYERIALICGGMDKVFNLDRLEGYKRALARHQMPMEPNWIVETDGSKNQAYSAMKALLQSDNCPDAVICGDNILSFGVMKAAQEMEVSIPKDLGLVSFDNYPLATLVEPSLTSIHIDVFQMGEMAANSLLALIDNPDASQQQMLISTAVEVRESSIRRT
jgi:DNA-binding LacI/PurR family transcriptional regulator